MEDELVDRAQALRGLPRIVLDRRIEDVDPTDPFELLVPLRALGDRPDAKAALAPHRPRPLEDGSGKHGRAGHRAGIRPLVREILVRLIVEADPRNSKNNRRIIIPALKKLGLTGLIDRLTERYANGGDYFASLAADPNLVGRFR